MSRRFFDAKEIHLCFGGDVFHDVLPTTRAPQLTGLDESHLIIPPESWHARFLQPHLSRIPFGFAWRFGPKKNKAFVAFVHYITIIIIIYLHYHRMLRLRGELGISRWHRFLPSSRSSVDDEELWVDAQLVQETAAETAICSPADTQIACFQKNLDWRTELAPFTEILYFECLTVQPLFPVETEKQSPVMSSICYTLWAATTQLIWCNDVINDLRFAETTY